MAATVMAGGPCAAADEAELFEQAYGHYLAYRPEKAVEAFNTFIKAFPGSSALDGAHFWKAKALVMAGRPDEAREILSSFADRFPDSPFGRFTEDSLAEMKNAPDRQIRGTNGARPAEPRTDRNGRAAKALTEKARVLEGRITEFDAENRRLKKAALKAADERASLAKDLKEARQRVEDLTGRLKAVETGRTEQANVLEEKAALDRRLRELEARLAVAAEEARQAEEKARLLALERDDALASARSGGRSSSLPAAGEAVMEREKDLRELNEQIRRTRELEAEKKALQEQWDRYRREKDEELARLKAERGGSQSRSTAGAQEDKALADLQKRLAEAEQRSRDSAGQLKTVADEKTLLANRLKEAEQQLAELGAARKAVEQEKARAAAVEQEKARAAAVEQEKTRAAAVEQEKARARLERPAVKIGGKTYSLAQIEEDREVAARVLARTRRTPVSWHTGSAVDDFVAERVLAARAAREDARRQTGETASLAKQYSLSAQEQEYLLRFLLADDQVRRRQAFPGEEDLLRYYEANKAEFAAGKRERLVQSLTLRHSSSDKLASVQLVADLQREAMAGKPLEEIARGRAGKVSFSRSRMEDLPEWVRGKVKNLREGAISNIFTEDRFMMLQVVTTGSVRGFDEVKGDIRARLLSREKDLAGWLDDVRKEAADLR